MRSLSWSFRFFRLTSSSCSGSGKVRLVGELMESIVQFVMLGGQLVVLLVGLHHQVLQVLLFAHAPPP